MSDSRQAIANSQGARETDGPLRVAYAIVASPLGPMLVAATRKGVCAVAFGDSEARLCHQLSSRYPHASIRRDDDALRRWTELTLAHLGGEQRADRIALDLKATPFQRRVWRELIAIPAGETRSYTEIARRIGRPTAARAVGAAIGRNPVAVLIPCHRAVGADGSLRGYRWGLARKARLLAIERVRSSSAQRAGKTQPTHSPKPTR